MNTIVKTRKKRGRCGLVSGEKITQKRPMSTTQVAKVLGLHGSTISTKWTKEGEPLHGAYFQEENGAYYFDPEKVEVVRHKMYVKQQARLQAEKDAANKKTEVTSEVATTPSAVSNIDPEGLVAALLGIRNSINALDSRLKSIETRVMSLGNNQLALNKEIESTRAQVTLLVNEWCSTHNTDSAHASNVLTLNGR